MKRLIPWILLISIAFLGWLAFKGGGSITTYRQTVTPQAQAMAVITSRPTIASTSTPVPSPTVDYKSTADTAIQTADEARRVNAVVTAGYEQRILEQVRITEANNQRAFERERWTATAALTSIPLTASQQAVLNTQIPRQQEMVFAQITATWAAPTQIVAIANAEKAAKFSKSIAISQLIGTWAVIMFIIAIVIFLFTHPSLKGTNYEIDANDEDDAEEEPRKMTIDFENRSHGRYGASRSVLPLDEVTGPALLDEFASAILNKEKTLGINHWEGEGTLWTRDIYLPFRAWLRNPFNEDPRNIKRAFAIVDERGHLVPTTHLYEFLNHWVNTRKLTDEHEFEKPKESPGQVVSRELATEQ